MKHAHRLAALGIVFALVIGVVFLTAVQAQTNTSVITQGSSEYDRLAKNIPIVPALVEDNIPIINAKTNIRQALELIAAGGSKRSFAAVTAEDNGLYIFSSDGDRGEVFVYQFSPGTTGFHSLDCSDAPFDGETKDIYSGIMRGNEPIYPADFLRFYDCDESTISFSLSYEEAKTMLASLSSQISTTYGSSTAEATLVAPATYTGEKSPVKESVLNTPSVVSCTQGEIIREYTLSTDGKVNMTGSNPNAISNNPFDYLSDDSRDAASILIKDGTATKYMVTLSNHRTTTDTQTILVQLCYNDNGWKSVWQTASYSRFKGDRFESVVRNTSTTTPITMPFENRDDLPEVLATFHSDSHEKVSVYLYTDEAKKSIYSIAVDASRDADKRYYRFDLDKASIQAIVDNVAAASNMTPNLVRTFLADKIKVIGQKELTNETAIPNLGVAEGILNSGNASNNTHWKLSPATNTARLSEGEYLFTITIPGYRPIERVITINDKDLSASSINLLRLGDVKLISILPTDLKKDRCSGVNDLTSALLCADTAFVDAFTAAK